MGAPCTKIVMKKGSKEWKRSEGKKFLEMKKTYDVSPKREKGIFHNYMISD